jgi:hypothetical protein
MNLMEVNLTDTANVVTWCSGDMGDRHGDSPGGIVGVLAPLLGVLRDYTLESAKLSTQSGQSHSHSLVTISIIVAA